MDENSQKGNFVLFMGWRMRLRTSWLVHITLGQMHHRCLQAQILVCSKSFARHKLNQNYINLPRDEKGNAKRRLTKISEILGRPGENGEGRVKSHAAFKPSGYRMNLRKRCDVLDWVIGSLGHWDAW